MNTFKLIQYLTKKFPFDPTSQQLEVIKQLSDFIENSSSNSLFLLKGYAGTGKTTIVSSLINSLWSVGKKVVLLAPTGRAAKVLSVYSKKSAFTIHKKIYWMRTNSKGNNYVTLKENKHTNTIFVVDEASMIPDASDKGFGGRVLLDDLIEYVYSGVMCKLILIGDSAQLPPVHLEISPALDENLLRLKYRKDIYSVELTQVVRQQSNSMVLENATQLRDKITANDFDRPSFKCSSEVVRLDLGMEIQEALEDAYSISQVEGTVVICRSNKRANLYNQQIRALIRGLENDISTGDFLMIVRNNYYWLPEGSKAGFIANGDMVEVMRIYEINELYDYKFARISVRLIDYPNEEYFECIVFLDTLKSENPALTYEQYKKLYDEVSKDYTDIIKRAQRIKEIKQNPYLNALQVKFAYAITCHKSQGGQWENVFVDQGYYTSDMLSKEYFRWLYTAITRTTKKLHLINFKKEFFE
ncbi:MAG: ATP-dependent endonuclease [Flavobacteriales bacterium]|nr:ATP-dependent endonuclease [Flavobacteriales bacterium]